ncbi:putative catechol 1,2-dioxygenase [Halenospora varia]|nr:putative catechol 1,2-dioxygenase [Halenospora varia]
MAPSQFAPGFTQHCLDTIDPKCTPRNKEVIGSLIKHIHDWAREVELSVDEWMTGLKFVNSIGQASTPIRNEGHRICDVIGLESIVQDPTPNAQPTYIHGKITDLLTGKGIPNAYDFQDPENQSPNNLRGKFRTDANDEYHFYCLKPTAYSLPTDGPAGVLLKALDRHPMRPAHIHLMISADDYKPVITQIFPKDDPYLTTDTVYAVKDDLVVDFLPREGDPKAKLDLVMDVKPAPKSFHGMPPRRKPPSV